MLSTTKSSALSNAEESRFSWLQIMLWGGALILATVSSLLLTSAARAQQAYSGQWLIDAKPQAEKVHLNLRYRRSEKKDGSEPDFNNSTSFDIPIAQLSGLTPPQIMSAAGGQVKFQLVRDAGTVDCEGWFKEGHGAGHFVFTPNAGFAAELTKRGYAAPTVEQQFMMAFHGVDLNLIEELRIQGFKQPTTSLLVRMGTHGVRLNYMKELHGLGYRVKSAEELIRMVDHGVSLRYIRNLAALGYERLSPEELVRAADHGVSSYENVPVEQLIKLVDHGVSISFIEKARAAGHKDLDQMIYLHNHGIEAKKSSAQSREQEW